MSHYLHDILTISKGATPQSMPIPGSAQHRNNAGGYGWEINDWQRLDRFLILGSEGGTYYSSERALTAENLNAVSRCITENGVRVVQRVVEMRQSRRAPKNDPALFVLAMCASCDDQATRSYALQDLGRVALIGTDLFHFVAFVDRMRGWGRALRKAVANWYQRQDIGDLVYQLIKYRQRDGWSHRDLMRKSHPKTTADIYNRVYQWVTSGVWKDEFEETSLEQLSAFRRIQKMPHPFTESGIQEIRRLVFKYNLPRECVPTQALKHPEIWRALAVQYDGQMPMVAMVRNLANMTRVGVFDQQKWVDWAADRLTDPRLIQNSGIHPVQILAALCTYTVGHGIRGSGEWTPIPKIAEALEQAFYLSFKNAERTDKRYVVAIDVSASMASGTVAGVPGLTPALAAAAMAMVHLRSEEYVRYMAFTDKPTEVVVSESATLFDVVKAFKSRTFGRTDCALPMLWALDREIEADVFVIYTDNETWCGNIHPVQALRQYREQTGIDAKLCVVAMTSSGFSIADPDDPGMLDCVGFDTATPQIISQFAVGFF